MLASPQWCMAGCMADVTTADAELTHNLPDSQLQLEQSEAGHAQTCGCMQ